MEPLLNSWSWQSIQDTYRIYGKMLREYDGFKKRCYLPDNINIGYTDETNVFITRFNEEVGRIDRHLSTMDREIARRNSLIGVMG